MTMGAQGQTSFDLKQIMGLNGFPLPRAVCLSLFVSISSSHLLSSAPTLDEIKPPGGSVATRLGLSTWLIS